MSQADWEPLSASWSQPAWSSGCPTGTHCTPPKPHKLAKQLPVCSVHLTRLLPGGSYFYFYTSLMGPRHPTAARWSKQFKGQWNKGRQPYQRHAHPRNERTTAGEADKIEQIQGNVLTYTLRLTKTITCRKCLFHCFSVFRRIGEYISLSLF